jgi:hypothetical protein
LFRGIHRSRFLQDGRVWQSGEEAFKDNLYLHGPIMEARSWSQNLKNPRYWVGPRGVEPKLKLKIGAIPGLPRNGSHSSTIVERIILGPSLSSPLARNAILKMLDTLGK